MGRDSKIEWLARPGTRPATWNPVRARNLETGKVGWYCTKPTRGCKFCYAERWNIARGNGLPYVPASLKKLEIFLDENFLIWPIRWQGAHTIFPFSMSDLFGEFVSDAMLDMIFAVMAITPRHTYIVTTKRPSRAFEYLNDPNTPSRINGWIMTMGGVPNAKSRWPLPNIWLGVSVTDDKDDGFLQALHKCPAVLRWVSYEPATGFVDFSRYPWIDWLVIGGESGSDTFFQTWWADRNISSMRSLKIPVFLKQLGAHATGDEGQEIPMKDRKGGDPTEWPAGLRVREFPQRVECFT